MEFERNILGERESFGSSYRSTSKDTWPCRVVDGFWCSRPACRPSNRPVSEGPEVPMHPSDSPADRRDQETRAPAETPPSPGAVGQGKPRIYVKDGFLSTTFPEGAYSQESYEAFGRWAWGVAFRGWQGWR